MTLLIALFLFVQFDADLYWYVAAVAVWILHLPYHADFIRPDPDAPYLAKFVMLMGITTGGLAAVLAYPGSRDFLYHLLFPDALVEETTRAAGETTSRTPSSAGMSPAKMRAILERDLTADDAVTRDEIARMTRAQREALRAAAQAQMEEAAGNTP
jgi:hypothetical protein